MEGHGELAARVRSEWHGELARYSAVGEKEVAGGTLAVRDRVDGEKGSMPIDEVLALFEAEVERKSIRSTSSAIADITDRGAKFAE